VTPPAEIFPTAPAKDSSISCPEPWPEGIAIIGMSARFPQSRNVGEFWQHLVNGDSLISTFSDEELRRTGVDESMLSDSHYVRRGNIIEDADGFDAEFFGLSRREAEILDPQQRVFLECAWEALENAGRTGEGERVGVFAGAGMNTYILQLLANPGVLASAGSYQLMLASDKDYLATRAAYKLNLRGPAVTVQTACSTSLAAVHLACRSLLNRECTMALAGGVSISFPQGVGYSYIPGMILSPDGHCRPFDAQAAGTVPGRGAGVVVLKRMSDAIADGDSIVAVIRGSAWNNDGAGKVGYTAPSVDGQAEVICAALAAAGVEPGRVGYVETHGTATELGDAIECAALAQVFAAEERRRPLVLGAVKANMGHCDAAAGIAGLIKAALAVQSGIIPPTPGFARPNPALDLEKTSFVVSSSSRDWAHDAERWAGVSSFGIGGTNVHAVLSGSPAAVARKVEAGRQRIFPVSARTESALNKACQQLSQRLAADTTASAADVASTLQLGRRPFAFRRAVVAESCAEAAALLVAPGRKGEPGTDLARDVVFLFPGQGQQFPGMTEALYREDRPFRRIIDAGCSILQEYAGLDLRPFLTGSDKSPELAARLRETQNAQPALFLVEYALAERWRSLGAEPAALLGHSLGELTAACIAGVFSFEDGLRLAAERGRLMAQTAPGLMLAVMLPAERLAPFLDSGLWLAAENGPKMSVVSGLVPAVEGLERRLTGKGVAAVRLASKNAFHTPLMAEAAKAFADSVAAVARQAPNIPWLSNVSGTWIGSAEAQDPQYWANQIVSPVRFTRNLAALAERRRLLVELGPGEALLGIARQQLSTSVMAPCLGAENRRASDATVFHKAVALAWECGVAIQWERVNPESAGRRVPLPTYPFERQRCWIEPSRPAIPKAAPPAPFSASRGAESSLPAKREDISAWFYAPCWQSTPPAGIALPAQSPGPKCWLVLAGEDPLSGALISALRAQGHSVVSVKRGEGFDWQDGDAIVNPTSAVHLEVLWSRMDAAGLRPGGLLCLTGLDAGMASGYECILPMLQAAGPQRRYLRRFEFVTTAVESVNGEAVANPQGGELQGLARAISAELEGSACRCIDVEITKSELQPLVEQLLEELATRGPGLTVAYRRGTRWHKTWTPARLGECSKSPFRSGGVYLITGGTGGIGYTVAQYLLHSHAARVVVTGRRALPNRGEWEHWIALHGEGDATSRRIRRMQELESAGGEVLFLAADVADRESMREVIERTQQQFGPLNGVIHAAGVAGGSRIPFQSAEEARDIRKPKLQGSLVLAELMRGSTMDFLLLCSSISAVAPAPSQSAYAAANAFQNSLAAYCRGVLGVPAISIGFDAWGEVGMLAEMAVPEGMQSHYDEQMRRAMTNGEGIEVIRRVLSQWPGPQILTSTVALDRLSGLAIADSSEAQPDEEAAAYGESRELAAVLEIWKDLLGTDSIGPSDNFFSLGGHSLMATMMIARIRERLGVTLSLRDVFEAQTPAALAELVRFADEKTASEIARETLIEDQEREVFEI
jgi:phthiocerol/phenolphthiocerol synthesis type-I polyketide synthase E